MKKVLFALVLLYSGSAVSQSWQDTVSKIEAALGHYKPEIPGAQLTISRDGKILYSKAFGMANLEHAVRLTLNSPSEAGSVSKQFTAAAILLLEQEGKLNLDDDVREHLPEMPDYGKKITLRHMMQHTSGLKDWGSIAAMTGWGRGTKSYNNNDALYIASRQRTLNHLPGEEYIYSNSNYNLLAIIVQRASGQSLAEYTRRKIFEPAGMTNTQWRDDYRRIVPNRAIAYMKTSRGYLMNMPFEFVYGNGGLLTTTEDLVRWVDYYQGGKFGSPSLLQKQLSAEPFNNGRKHDYAAGLFISNYDGWPLITHQGITASYRAFLDYFPRQNLTIAFLSNNSEFDFENGLGTMVNILRDIFTDPVKEIPQPTYRWLPPEMLQSYEGWYENVRNHGGIKMVARDSSLWIENDEKFMAVAENHFIGTSGATLTFLNEKNRRMLIVEANGDSVFLDKRDSAALNEKLLAEYVGVYHSDEVDAKWKIILKNGQLFVSQLSGRATKELTPTFKDAFNGAGGYFLFQRDNKGKISNLLFSEYRARKMKFDKIE